MTYVVDENIHKFKLGMCAHRLFYTLQKILPCERRCRR